MNAQTARYTCHVLNCDCAGAMHGRQEITRNPSGDLCQHDAYADLCIVCHPGPTYADLDDRQKAVWHLENAIDALQHPQGLSEDAIRSALVCAARLERILFAD